MCSYAALRSGRRSFPVNLSSSLRTTPVRNERSKRQQRQFRRRQFQQLREHFFQQCLHQPSEQFEQLCEFQQFVDFGCLAQQLLGRLEFVFVGELRKQP
jgi:hypothetical protein